LELPVQFRRNRISGFDGGLTALPEYFRAQDVPANVPAGVPAQSQWTAFCSPSSTAPCNAYAPFGFRANVTSDPPLGGSRYHAGSVSFVQRSRFGLTVNTNYTYSHTQDNSTNEFFTSLLNPRRGQDTNHLSEDWANSDLDVRHKFSLAWGYDVPKAKTDNALLKAVLNGYQLGSVFLAQSGQPVTLRSGTDVNRNGDSAGDRLMFNPFGTNPTGGSDIINVCAPAGGGNTHTGSCNPAENVVGYLATDSTARYVVAGRGVRTNVGRNSITTPGFAVLNLSLGKRTYFTEGKYLLVKADIFNVLNHPNFALSNGNVFSVAGVTTATTTQGYVIPTDLQRRDSQYDTCAEVRLLDSKPLNAASSGLEECEKPRHRLGTRGIVGNGRCASEERQ
jgi:hypothetical protein